MQFLSLSKVNFTPGGRAAYCIFVTRSLTTCTTSSSISFYLSNVTSVRYLCICQRGGVVVVIKQPFKNFLKAVGGQVSWWVCLLLSDNLGSKDGPFQCWETCYWIDQTLGKLLCFLFFFLSASLMTITARLFFFCYNSFWDEQRHPLSTQSPRVLAACLPGAQIHDITDILPSFS